MTTIVADQRMGFMAADRMVTANDGDVTIHCDTKIEEVSIGGDLYLVGLAGLEGPGEVFLEWFREGEWDEPPEPMSHLDESESFSILILGPDGLFLVDKFMRMIPVHSRRYAVGSGGVFAWAILEAGCGIEKAMTTALHMDPNSGQGFEVKYLSPEQEDWNLGIE